MKPFSCAPVSSNLLRAALGRVDLPFLAALAGPHYGPGAWGVLGIGRGWLMGLFLWAAIMIELQGLMVGWGMGLFLRGQAESPAISPRYTTPSGPPNTNFRRGNPLKREPRPPG